MSYYSQQGARIAQAVGEYVPGTGLPVAKAFKDGVFGQQLNETMPGPLMASRDGSLGCAGRCGTRGLGRYFDGRAPMARAYREGSLGAPLYVNGQEMPSPVTITHAGTLGPAGAGNGDVVSDGGTLGAGAAEGPASGPSPETHEQTLSAWRDGVLGNPPYSQSMPGPLMAQYGGTVGAPPYSEAPVFTWPAPPVSGIGSLRGLGAAEAGALDLKDPATVRELKQALALAWPESLTQDNQRIWDAAFFESSVWGPKASDLTDRWVEFWLRQPEVTHTRAQLVVDTPKGMYPTAAGVATILATGVGSAGVGIDFAGGMPILYAWQQTWIATEGAGVSVSAPFFSESERVSAAGGMPMSTIALIGLGALGLVGAVVVLGGRRRRR